MSYELYGPYTTAEKTAEKVDVLALKGYRDEDISVIAKEDIAADLKKRVNANVISVLKDGDNSSVEHLYKTLENFDMSEGQTERYEVAMEDNKIIIALNVDHFRMGNRPEKDMDVLVEKL